MRSLRLCHTLLLAIGALLYWTPGLAQPSASDIRLEGGRFLVGGQPFVVRGVHYGPWRPGTGPNKGYPYPKREDIAADLKLIRQTGANTILVYDPPAEVLDVAQKYGLHVIYVFALDWWSFGGEKQSAVQASVLQRVTELKTHPALLAYMLGNEVSGAALQTRGEEPIVNGLRELYTAIKSVDSAHPISHANWPPARRLDLSFLDFISFNVYPLWPPEVVATGYERYITTVLRPIAGGKPLLISEFGATSLEAGEDGQARLIRESWHSLQKAGAAGGVAFEFADEWWKNYDNPVKPGDWWTREAAPDDEATADNDPEETYGLVKADRTPKPAYFAVKEIFSEPDQRHTWARSFGAAGLSVTLLAACGTYIWARRYQRRRA